MPFASYPCANYNKKLKSLLILIIIIGLLANVHKQNILAEIVREVQFDVSLNEIVLENQKYAVLTISTSGWKNIVKGIAAFNIKVEFNSDVFVYDKTEVTPESQIDIAKDDFTAYLSKENTLAILYMDHNFKTPIPEPGPVLISYFKIKEISKPGEYPFILSGDRLAVDGQLPNFNTVNILYPSPTSYKISNLTNNSSFESSESLVYSEIISSSLDDSSSQDIYSEINSSNSQSNNSSVNINKSDGDSESKSAVENSYESIIDNKSSSGNSDYNSRGNYEISDRSEVQDSNLSKSATEKDNNTQGRRSIFAFILAAFILIILIIGYIIFNNKKIRRLS